MLANATIYEFTPCPSSPSPLSSSSLPSSPLTPPSSVRACTDEFGTWAFAGGFGNASLFDGGAFTPEQCVLSPLPSPSRSSLGVVRPSARGG